MRKTRRGLVASTLYYLHLFGAWPLVGHIPTLCLGH